MTLYKRVTTCLAIPLLISCGGSGGGNGGTTTPPPPDVTAPTLSFSPATLTVASGDTGTATLSSSDNVGITSGPDVSCTNGGAYSGSTFTAPDVTVETSSVCTATASDAAGNSGSAELTVTITPPPPTSITGQITFDFVPVTQASGLDYDAASRKPARGVTVELLDGSDAVLATTQTDENGRYSVSVDRNTNVRIRAVANMENDGPGQWNVSVNDNTNADARYTLSGSLETSGVAASVRDLHGASGWGGMSYTADRDAAPFAILDTIYDAMTAVTAIDPAVDFRTLEVHWSPLNRPEGGDFFDANFGPGEVGTTDFRDGRIGFTRYAPFRIPVARADRGFGTFSNTQLGNPGSYGAFTTGPEGKIFLLGAADVNTDEYDRYVVLREWAHHYQEVVSSNTFMGWTYDEGDFLDPRFAYGEGLAKAIAAQIEGDPVLIDTRANQQASAIIINIEDNIVTNPGWYRDRSTAAIIYDIMDSANDAVDDISLGLEGVHQVLTSDDYPGIYPDTIYTFIDTLTSQQPTLTTTLVNLKVAQNITGTGPNAVGETNDAGVPSLLPIFKSVLIGPATANQFNRLPRTEVCVFKTFGFYNKLGNWAFVEFDVQVETEYSVLMDQHRFGTNLIFDGLRISEPYFNLLKNNVILDAGLSVMEDRDNFEVIGDLTPGIHIVEGSSEYLYKFGQSGARLRNINSTRNETADDTLCYDVSVNPTP